MKRIIALLLLLCVSLSLVACNKDKPDPTGGGFYITNPTTQPAETTAPTVPATTEQETTAPVVTEPDNSALDAFLKKAQGVWIFDETIEPNSSGTGANFYYVFIGKKEFYTDFYPGGYYPGEYEGCYQADDKTYQVYIFYKKGDRGGNAMPQDTHELATFVITGKNKMKVKFDDGVYFTLIYGGKSFEDAEKTAFKKLPTEPPKATVTITPSTKVISEHSGYRIVRLDHSGRDSNGKVLVEQYYDYVELTDGSPAAKKINSILKPGESIFQTESDLQGYAEMIDPSYPFQNKYVSSVTFFNDKWLCVTTTSDWYMGGVHNAGNSALVFDISTGERVTLRAFAGEDPATFEEQLKSIVWSQIASQQPWDDAEETLAKYTLDTFNFAIPDGQIVLYFPVYEFFAGAYGPVTIETGLYIT